jgi:hypothetical protein
MSSSYEADDSRGEQTAPIGPFVSLKEANVRGLAELKREYAGRIQEIEEYKKLRKEFDSKALGLITAAAKRARLSAGDLAPFMNGMLSAEGCIVCDQCITSCIGCVACDGCIAATPL